jgi:hypothetical protein
MWPILTPRKEECFMARLRLLGLLALAAGLMTVQTGRSQGLMATAKRAMAAPPCCSSRAGPVVDSVRDSRRTCVLYALDRLGGDPDLGRWVAETIPEVIAPETWKDAGGEGVLRYYAPKNILLIYHTPSVQTKVDDFLESVKKSVPTEPARAHDVRRKPAREQSVVPADYRAPVVQRTGNWATEPATAYPVPGPVKPPKHLFHFIIRYEGEGLIDDSVVKFWRIQTRAEQKEKQESSGSAGYAAPAQTGPTTSAPSVLPSLEEKKDDKKEDKKAEKKDKKEKEDDKKEEPNP